MKHDVSLIVVFLWLLLCPLSAPADSCKAIDYRGQLGANRNQEDSDWCFAYSVADLITQKTGAVVSALDVGTAFYIGNVDDLARAIPEVQNYYQRNKASLRQLLVKERNAVEIDGGVPHIHRLSAGQEDGAILMANIKGLCREKELPSEGGFSRADLALLERLARKAVQSPISCEGWTLLTGVSSQLNSPAADCVNAQWLATVDRRCERLLNRQPLLPEVSRAAFDLEAYRSLLRRGKLDAHLVRKSLMDKLNSVLNSGRIAAVGYNGHLIWGLDLGSSEGDHSSAVVARRKVNGSCQYLVRDSFGTDCSIYDEKFHGPDRCESGNIWLTEDELAGTAQMYSVIAIK